MALSVGTPISAKFAKVRINWLYAAGKQPGAADPLNKTAPQSAGVTLVRSNWRVTPRNPLEDTSNFEGLGFTDQIAVLTGADITVGGWFDAGQNEYDSPPNLIAGRTYSVGVDGGGLALFLKDLDGPYFFFPAWIISEPPVTSDVHGIVLFEFAAKSKSIFYYPSGQPTSAT
jgi:hypothetical protein